VTFRWNYAGLECYNSNGTAIPEYVALMSRTYARAIAGIPSSMAFNKTTSNFTLCYNLPSMNVDEWKPTGSVQSTPISQQTEIYHNPSVFYPGGAVITTSPNVVASVVGNLVLVVPSASANPGELACVSLNRQ
jgi:Glycoside hydrolase family 5 C-terminal domain